MEEEIKETAIVESKNAQTPPGEATEPTPKHRVVRKGRRKTGKQAKKPRGRKAAKNGWEVEVDEKFGNRPYSSRKATYSFKEKADALALYQQVATKMLEKASRGTIALSRREKAKARVATLTIEG